MVLGNQGKVVEIRGWDHESGNSVADVIWSSGSKNVYRLGHKGKCDLKCVAPESGGLYYRNHLPILGQCIITLQADKILNVIGCLIGSQSNFWTRSLTWSDFFTVIYEPSQII